MTAEAPGRDPVHDAAERITPEELEPRFRRLMEDRFVASFEPLRTIGGTLAYGGVVVLFAAAFLIDEVEALMGVGAPEVGALLTVQWLVVAAAAVAARFGGLLGRPHRALEHAETTVTMVVGAALLWLAGTAATPLWIVPVLHLSQIARQVLAFRWDHASLIAVYGGLAVAFAVAGSGGDAALTVAITGAMVWMHRSQHDMERDVLRAVAEREVLADRLRRERVEAERARIARDLHDSVAADLTSLVWRARALARENGAEAPDEGLEEVVERARRSLADLRTVVLGLRSPPDGTTELVSLLEARCRELCDGRVEVDFTADAPVPDSVPSGIREALVPIAQELVRNAVRHAGATRVSVEVGFSDEVRLTVRDDGRGLPDGAVDTSPGGLANVRARLAAVGGTLRSECDGKGTRISAHIPHPP